MASVMYIDTQKITRRLVESGLTEAQADSITDVARDIGSYNLEHLATKKDLEQSELRLKGEILVTRKGLEQSELRLNEKIEAQGAALGIRIEALDEKIEAQGAALNEKIEAQGAALNEKIEAQGAALSEKIETQGKMLQNDIIVKLGALMVVLFGLFFALLKSFPLAS